MIDLIEHPEYLITNIGDKPTIAKISVYMQDNIYRLGSHILADVEVYKSSTMSRDVQTAIPYKSLCRSLHDFMKGNGGYLDSIQNIVTRVEIFPEFKFDISFEYRRKICHAEITSDSLTFENFMKMSEHNSTWSDFFCPTTALRPFIHVIKISAHDKPISTTCYEEASRDYFKSHRAPVFTPSSATFNTDIKPDISDTIVLTNLEPDHLSTDSGVLGATMNTTADYIKNMVEPTSPLVEKPQPVELSEEDKQRKMAQQVKDREDLMQAVNNLRDTPVTDDVSEMGEASAITPDNTDIFSTEK